ncbi:MAG: hypothetical protein RJB38_2052 [Pseudomonadota bacterium]|jgi:uncharacterized membrane protein YeaQ/YmgE (transglycosylase-associated protein family)
MEILSWVLFGFVVGLLARAVFPGRDPMGLVGTTVLGIVGALVGGWVGQLLGLYRAGQSAGYIGATVGAVLLLFGYHLVMRRRPRLRSVGRSEKPQEPRKPGQAA